MAADHTNALINYVLGSLGDARDIALYPLLGFCSLGNLGRVKFASKLFGYSAAEVRDDGAVNIAIDKGHPDVASWLITAFNLTNVDAVVMLIRACKFGELGTTQWLHERFGFSDDNASDALSATLEGVRRVGELPASLDRDIVIGRHKKIIKLLGETFEIVVDGTSC